jgi:hypothetical protein
MKYRQIPVDCVSFDVKWQTDPPRRQFLGPHVSWFVLPTLAFMSFGTAYKYAETDGGGQVAGHCFDSPKRSKL